jgi:hypothetical protein
MSATEFQSMLHAGKVSRTGERELKKHLCAHLGQGFCPTRHSVNMLLEGHGIVHYDSCDFTYDGKEKPEFVEWTEKNINKEICIFLQRLLLSKLVQPSDVVLVQVVVGGNHGNTAFQFGASVSVELANNCIIDFEVLICKLICRKDTGCLLEQTILPRLTDGLEIIATFELHIFNDDECGVLVAEYRCHAGNSKCNPEPHPHHQSLCDGRLGFPGHGSWKRVHDRAQVHAMQGHAAAI